MLRGVPTKAFPSVGQLFRAFSVILRFPLFLLLIVAIVLLLFCFYCAKYAKVLTHFFSLSCQDTCYISRDSCTSTVAFDSIVGRISSDGFCQLNSLLRVFSWILELALWRTLLSVWVHQCLYFYL